MTSRAALHTSIWVYTALHAAVAAWLPLAAFEAHYALYATHPALSYVDHPPLAAWLQSLALLVGDTALVLRVIPIGLSACAMYLLDILARRCYPDYGPWLGVACVAVLQGTLVFHSGMTMSPDAPLIVLALLVALAALGVMERDRWSDWLTLGLLVGLAGLAKYTAVTLAASFVGFLIWRRGWSSLASLKPWSAALLAVVVISPVLIWNATHDWITVEFHLGYQVRTAEEQAWSPMLFVVGQLSQLLFYSPLLYVGGISVIVRPRRPGTDAERLLYAFALPVLALFILASLASRGSAHWSLVGWVLLIPLVVRWAFDHWSRPFCRGLTYVSAGYSAALIIAIAIVVVPVIKWPEFRQPIRALVGWQEASTRARDWLERFDEIDGAGQDQGTKVNSKPTLLVRNWHHAERLAWYARPLPVQNVLDKLSPYSFMFGQPDVSTRGILVYPRRAMEAPTNKSLWPEFECRPIDRLPVSYGASIVNVFHFYHCVGGR